MNKWAKNIVNGIRPLGIGLLVAVGILAVGTPEGGNNA